MNVHGRPHVGGEAGRGNRYCRLRTRGYGERLLRIGTGAVMSLHGDGVFPLGQGNLQVDFGRCARSKRTPAIHQYSPGLDRVSRGGRCGCQTRASSRSKSAT